MEIVRSRAAVAYRKRWKQVVFFPEGMSTNGELMGCFKPGAFLPGLSVQPVTIKTKRHLPLHLTSWTHTGPGDLTCNLFQFLVPWQELEVHYLEPYKPSEEEKSDPELYAYNVQRTMAKHRKMTATDYSLHDGHMIHRAVTRNNFKHLSGLVGFEGLAWRYKLRTNFVRDQVFGNFIAINNYMFKRKEVPEKRGNMLGDGSIFPSISCQDMSYFYGFKSFDMVFKMFESNKVEEQTLPFEVDSTRILDSDFTEKTEMTSRQWCEHFCKIIYEVGSHQPSSETIEQLAKKLEPAASVIFKSNIENDPDSDYRIVFKF